MVGDLSQSLAPESLVEAYRSFIFEHHVKDQPLAKAVGVL